MDEKEWTSSVRKGLIDPLCDFDKFDSSVEFKDDDPTPSSSNMNSEQLLIKRCTQQSIRILGSLEAAAQNKKSLKSSTSNPVKIEPGTEGPKETPPEPHHHEKHDWTFYDLAGIDVDGDFLDDENKVNTRVHQVEREKYSIVPQTQLQQVTASVVKSHLDAINSWEPKLTESLNCKDATEALKNLSPAGYLMRSSNSHRLADTVPEEIQKKLKVAYYGTNELLRHFWLCFPVNDQSLEEKLVKIHDTLKKFETNKLQPLYDSLPRDQRHLLGHIMRRQMIAASRQYEHWRSKKRQRELQANQKVAVAGASTATNSSSNHSVRE